MHLSGGSVIGVQSLFRVKVYLNIIGILQRNILCYFQINATKLSETESATDKDKDNISYKEICLLTGAGAPKKCTLAGEI